MRIIGIALAACLLAGCASSSDEPDVRGVAQFADNPSLGKQVDRICFASSIDGFSNETRDTIVLHEGRDSYLVEVFGGCFQLRDAMRIGVDAHSGCLRKGDSLVVSDSMFGGTPTGPERCLVQAIYEWDPDAKTEEAVEDADATAK